MEWRDTSNTDDRTPVRLTILDVTCPCCAQTSLSGMDLDSSTVVMLERRDIPKILRGTRLSIARQIKR